MPKFYHLYADYSIFIIDQSMNSLIIIIFINNFNIFVFYRSRIVSYIKVEQISAFDIIDIRFLTFYVRLQITQNCQKQIIKIFQLDYIEKLLNWYSILITKVIIVFI